jgi:hypothetical protein
MGIGTKNVEQDLTAFEREFSFDINLGRVASGEIFLLTLRKLL